MGRGRGSESFGEGDRTTSEFPGDFKKGQSFLSGISFCLHVGFRGRVAGFFQ